MRPPAKAAFDSEAAAYDAAFTSHPIARILRDRVQARLLKRFPPGAHVLELGCGTGEDARFLAESGVIVTATDASESMLAIARRKCAHLNNVQFRLLDLNDPPDDQIRYDSVFANFGVINCARDLSAVARWLADRVRPGGHVAFAVMARTPAWEILWHAAHGDFRTAFRRVRGTGSFATAAGTIPLVYPTVRAITDAFSPSFRRTHIEPLGVFLPTSDAYGAIERHPRLMQILTKTDEYLGRAPFMANAADHYWIEWIRTESAG